MFWERFVIHLINKLVRAFNYILENISANIMAIDLLLLNQLFKSQAFYSYLIEYTVILTSITILLDVAANLQY